jgi:hypothetical protein
MNRISLRFLQAQFSSTPANVPHHVWARDREAIYQESWCRPNGEIIQQTIGKKKS